MITEADIKAAQSGDSEAFTKIYNETIKTAYYVAKHILIDVDSDVVEDVLQEAYVAVYKHLGDYKAGNFQGWVDTIVANRAKNYMRKKNPTLFSEMETEENIVVEFEDENIEFRPDENIDYSETKRLVMEIVDGLPADQRLATLLFYFEQRSVKEIAEICECSENTVKSRLNYARKKIKEDVLALEKKGTKLYSVSIIPFLIWMFSEEAKACVVSEATSEAVLTGIQSATGEVVKAATQETAKAVAKEAASEVGKEVATETAKVVAKEVAVEAAKVTAGEAAKVVAAKAGMALGTKIAIAVTAATVTIGGVAGGVAVVQHLEDTYEEDDDEEDEDNHDRNDENNENGEILNTETEEDENTQPEIPQVKFRLKRSVIYKYSGDIPTNIPEETVIYSYAGKTNVYLESTDATGEKYEYLGFVYDDDGRLINSNPKTDDDYNYVYEYNEDGLLIKTIQEYKGYPYKVTEHVYDSKGYLIKEVEYQDGEPEIIWTYTNDASGKVIELQSAWAFDGEVYGRHTYQYDVNGQLIKKENFSVSRGEKTGEDLYSYDQNGNLVKHENFYGGKISSRKTYTYDANNNCVSEVYEYSWLSDGTHSTTKYIYEYEEVPNVQQEDSTNDTEINPGAGSLVEGQTAEEDIFVKVGNVNIPIDSTWDELVAICQDNGWTIEDKLYPDESGWSAKPYNQKGSIETPDGELLVCIMPNEENTGAVIEYIALSPFYYDGEASVLGITTRTSLDEIAAKFELIEERGEHIYYYVDKYVTLKVSPDTYEGENTVSVVRTEFSKR